MLKYWLRTAFSACCNTIDSQAVASSSEATRPFRFSRRPFGQASPLVRVPLIVLGVYLVMVAMLTLMQRSLTYFPTRTSRIRPADARLPAGQVHDIQLRTSDALTLHGWHVLPADQTAEGAEQAAERLEAGGPVVLYFPGNGGDRTFRGEELLALTRVGCHVFLFDYRGYGDNPGRPSETALVDDAWAAWQYATDERNLAAERIILYGESLGSAVAVQLAARASQTGTPPGGLVLRSPFSSLADVASHHYPWLPVRWLLLDRYESTEHIRGVTCPILVLHGRRDAIIPLRFAERLYQAAPATSASGIPKRFVELPQADHNDVIFVHPREVQSALESFLSALPDASTTGG